MSRTVDTVRLLASICFLLAFCASANAVTLLLSEVGGQTITFHHGQAIAWKISGDVMQVAYLRDDIFAAGFQ